MLSQEDREKFITYLKEEAHNIKFLIEQTEKLSPDDTTIKNVCELCKQRLFAYTYVAYDLESIEGG